MVNKVVETSGLKKELQAGRCFWKTSDPPYNTSDVIFCLEVIYVYMK